MVLRDVFVMLLGMKKQIILSTAALIVMGVSILFIWNDFALVRRMTGYFKPHATTAPTTNGSVAFLTSSPGISISLYAQELTTPRVIAFDPRGRMFVSERDAGRVTRIDDTDGDGVVDNAVVILEGLNTPHGLAFYTDPVQKYTYLYIAETHQVARYLYDVPSGTLASKTGKNIMTFPKIAGQHITRTIGFSKNLRTGNLLEGTKKGISGSDSPLKLYASVGSTCDTCIETSWKSAAILEADPEGQYAAQFAGGLRNAVFFAFHPVTGQMWATEMGRDNLGDDLPPDEVNIITENGWYGWPFCYGNRVRDTKFTPAKIDRTDIPQNCAETKSPLIEIPAHSAPLGLGFIPSAGGWPSDWVGDLVIAYHGSWNRSVPTGYKVVRYDLGRQGNVVRGNDGKPVVTDLITGWYDGSKVSGRPVDIKFSSDGTLYITDDAAGRVYRVTYSR